MKKKDDILLNTIAQKKAYIEREQPLWRERNKTELAERRAKSAVYEALAKKVEAHFPQFDEIAKRLNRSLRIQGIFEQDLQLKEIDLGESMFLSTMYERRQYVIEEGLVQFKLKFIPEDDFFRDGVLFSHRIHIRNTSWFPDEWNRYIDLPVDLELLNDNHLDTYAIIIRQFKKRIDLLRSYFDQDKVISKMCYRSAVKVIEKKLLERKVLKRPFWDFNGHSDDCLQGDSGELTSIILCPPSSGSASFSVGPSDSKRSSLPFGLNMEEYDTMTEEGRTKLDGLIELMIVLTKDNSTWSPRRNVYCLQYDGW